MYGIAPEELPNRHHPAHGVRINPIERTIVFVTICTKYRKPWLATSETHQQLCEIWTDATAWRVGRYVLMPDHVHLFVAPGTPALPLDNWMRYWKSKFTKGHGVKSHRWQSHHWDTRLRHSQSYDAKWEYVMHNPARHGLVRRAEDWPFRGEIFHLPW